MQTICCQNIEDLNEVAEKLLKSYPNNKIFALRAEMGVGKTTFMQAVCKQLGSNDKSNSPTFAIINEYLIPNGKKIYHLDCYRLKNINEAREIGIEDYLYGNDYCFIEWAENIEELLPEDTVNVKIETENPYFGGNRIFKF